MNESGDQPTNAEPTLTFPDDLLRILEADLASMAAEGPFTRELAAQELVKGSDGKVTDIRYTQRGKTANLKDVFPGTYTIDYDPNDRQSEYFPPEDRILLGTGDDPTPSVANARLVHEAGHALSQYAHPQYYDNVHRLIAIVGGKKGLADFLLKIYPVDLKLTQLSFDFLWEELQSFNKEFGLSESSLELARKSVHQSYQYLSTGLSKQDLEKYQVTQTKRFKQISIKSKVFSERDAWARGAQGIREFRRRGINLFVGTRQELFTEVRETLATYQDNNHNTITSKYFFNRPDTRTHK